MILVVSTRISTRQSHHALLERAHEELDRNFDRPRFSVHDLAREIGGVSGRQLQRLFYDSGTTFAGERTARRMRRAVELIERRRPIASVARGVGYSRSDHFSCAFKRYYGANPSRLAAGLRLARSLTDRARQPLPPVRAPYYRRTYSRWMADRRRFLRIAAEFFPDTEPRLALGSPHLLRRPDMRTGTARARFEREFPNRRRRRRLQQRHRGS
jgi:AraC-like DNA-binding protein